MKKSIILIVAICIFFSVANSKKDLYHYSQPRWVPHTVYDYSTMFNEKRYWLEVNQDSGEVLICYQRIDVNPEYYMTPNIHCYRASPIPVPEHLNISTPTHCWRAGNTIICRNDATGELMLDQTQYSSRKIQN